MIVTSEAIVLRVSKHGETSKIVTLYTKEYGKLNVIAKGAREVKSKFGGSLEMCAQITAFFYKKESQEGLFLLSKADLISANSGIMKSLDRMAAATEIIEIVIRSMHDEEQNLEVFELLASTLFAISTAGSEESVAPLQLRFYLEFCRIAGFELKLRTDDPAAPANMNRESRSYFEIGSGELKDVFVDLSNPHPPLYPGIRVAAEAKAVLWYLERASIEKAMSLRVTDRTRTQLIDLFLAFFAEHLPGISGRSLKSGKVFSSL